MPTKVSSGYKVATPGLGVILICFFLPWVLQSCGNAPPQQYSGWQLAIGNSSIETGYHGNPFIFLVPLTALIVGLLMWRAIRRGYLTPWDGLVPAGLGGLILLYLVVQFGQPVAQGSTRQLLYGLWGVVIGWVLVMAGAC